MGRITPPLPGRSRPDSQSRCSVSAHPLLHLLVEEASEQTYSDYMQDNVFGPLRMANSAFNPDGFLDRHTIPHARIDGDNIKLPVWTGNGDMLHTTAEDQARLMIALMRGGRIDDFTLLRPESVELMCQPASRFRILFKTSRDQQPSGHGLGVFLFRGGWVGHGGSSPGFQTLWRYHPTKRLGYVIMSNVNGILGGGANYDSARSGIFSVQDSLLAVLDPALRIRSRTAEIAIVGAVVLMWVGIARRVWLRKRNFRND